MVTKWNDLVTIRKNLVTKGKALLIQKEDRKELRVWAKPNSTLQELELRAHRAHKF